MTTMFVQLRRVVYLLVLLQCCVCVAYADDDAEKTKAVKFLRDWMEGSEKQLAEGKGYKEVWNARVGTCAKKADEAKTVAEKTKKLVEGIAAEVKKHKDSHSKTAVSEDLVKLVENASKELEEDLLVFGKAMDTVEKIRKMVVWSSGAMQNMQDYLESQNHSRVYYTEELKKVPEDKRPREHQLLIERSERLYKEMDEVYQRLKVISKRSIACSRETNQRVMDTKIKMLEAVKLFEGMKDKFDLSKGEVQEKVKTYDEAVRESLKDDLSKKEPAHEETSKDIVGRASESTIGGAAPLATKNRTVETTDLKEKLETEKKKEEKRLEQKKKEEEQELEKRIEERRVAAERRRQEEERQKQAAAAAAAAAEAQRVKEEQERKEREKQAKKEREEKAKRDAEEKARRDAEEKAKQEAKKAAKKKKDGSRSPALMHGPLLILLVLSVLGCTFVC